MGNKIKSDILIQNIYSMLLGDKHKAEKQKTL